MNSAYLNILRISYQSWLCSSFSSHFFVFPFSHRFGLSFPKFAAPKYHVHYMIYYLMVTKGPFWAPSKDGKTQFRFQNLNSISNFSSLLFSKHSNFKVHNFSFQIGMRLFLCQNACNNERNKIRSFFHIFSQRISIFALFYISQNIFKSFPQKKKISTQPSKYHLQILLKTGPKIRVNCWIGHWTFKLVRVWSLNFIFQ